MRRLLWLVCIFLSLPSLSSRGRDSLLVRESERFHWPQLVLPSVVMTAGAVGVGNAWFDREINTPIRDWAASLPGNRSFYPEDYLQYLALGAFVLSGREHGMGERALVLATSWVTLGILVNTVKYTVGDLRPDGSTRNSFPSGHTATAFMGAELVRKELGPWWGAGAYVLAAGTGFLRIYHDRHWFNDVLGGAAVGFLCANVGTWLLPWERKLFPRITGSVSLLPQVGSGFGSPEYGFALSWVF